MLAKLLLAVLATAVLAQSPFAGDGSDSNRRPPPRPRPDGQGAPDGLLQRPGGGQGGQGGGQGGGRGGGQRENNEKDNSNGMRVLDPQATLLAIISMAPEKRDHCGKWGDWKEVKCWWPDQNFSSLPAECTNITYPKMVPQILKNYIDAKVKEVYAVIQSAYQRRGAPPKCGHCTHSFKCRSRNVTDGGDGIGMDMDMGMGMGMGMEMGMEMGMGMDMDMDPEMDMEDDDDSDESSTEEQGQGRRPRPRPRPRPGPGRQCKTKEIRPIDDAACDDAKACKVSALFGGCPAPLFLHKDKMRKINILMMNGDHEGALDAIDSLQNDGEDEEMDSTDGGSTRKKRQSGFYDQSDFYGGYPGIQPQMSMNGPWQSNDAWTGSSQSRNPFLPWRRQERQMETDEPYRRPMQFDDFAGDRYGPERWTGRGGQDFDGSDRRAPGGSDWDRRSWGPPRGGDDERTGRGDWDDGRPGPGGASRDRRPGGRDGWDRDDDRRRPGPGPRDWDRDDDRRGPGPRRQGSDRDDWSQRGAPRRPAGDRDDRRGQDRDDRRGPGPRRDWERDERRPWGPGRRDQDDRRPPPPRGPGRGDDEEDRRPRFGPLGSGFDQQDGMDDRRGGRGGHGGGGGGHGGHGKHEKGGKAKFIANLLHGTNCVSTGNDCLCCCGGYIPDVASGDCRAIRGLMPQLPKLLDFAMKKEPVH